MVRHGPQLTKGRYVDQDGMLEIEVRASGKAAAVACRCSYCSVSGGHPFVNVLGHGGCGGDGVRPGTAAAAARAETGEDGEDGEGTEAAANGRDDGRDDDQPDYNTEAAANDHDGHRRRSSSLPPGL